MEKFWNCIHYNIYLFEVKSSKIITIPITFLFDYIYKIPIISNQLKKKNTSREELVKITNDAINNPEYGTNSIWASIQMGGMLVLIEYSLFNILQAFLGKSLIQYVFENRFYTIIFLIGSLIILGIINYNLLWKRDKYLLYFDSFKKETKKNRIKWAWISFIFVMSVIAFFIFSIYLLTVFRPT